MIAADAAALGYICHCFRFQLNAFVEMRGAEGGRGGEGEGGLFKMTLKPSPITFKQ